MEYRVGRISDALLLYHTYILCQINKTLSGEEILWRVFLLVDLVRADWNQLCKEMMKWREFGRDISRSKI